MIDSEQGNTPPSIAAAEDVGRSGVGAIGGETGATLAILRHLAAPAWPHEDDPGQH